MQIEQRIINEAGDYRLTVIHEDGTRQKVRRGETIPAGTAPASVVTRADLVALLPSMTVIAADVSPEVADVLAANAAVQDINDATYYFGGRQEVLDGAMTALENAQEFVQASIDWRLGLTPSNYLTEGRSLIAQVTTIRDGDLPDADKVAAIEAIVDER